MVTQRDVVAADDEEEARAINALKWSGFGLRALPDAREFAHVTVLNVSSNALVTLDGVRCLPRLRALDASNNRLVDLRAVHYCRELREIDCSANAIRDVRGLGVSCAKLRVFKASRNAFASDAEFDDFPALRELDLSYNCLGEGLPDLRACGGLVSLNVRGNAISTLRLAERLLPATTRHLDVEDNDMISIEEFRHLRHFPRLESLTFTGNPLEARARHYGYDARAVALFCAPRLRCVNGGAASRSSWALASKRLFLNDQGELCDDLLAMLRENVSPWVLGEYLRHVCGVESDEWLQNQRRESNAEPPSAMFTVSTFVPLRDVSGDAQSASTDEDDVVGAQSTFVVDSSRVFEDKGDPKEALDSTAHWLSHLDSDSSDDDSSSLLNDGDDIDDHEFSFDSLRMISPIRAQEAARVSASDDDDDFGTPLERGSATLANTSSIEFHSLAEDFTHVVVDDDNDDDEYGDYNDARASTSASAQNIDATPSTSTGGTMRLLKSKSSFATNESFENSPDLRPPVARDGGHGSFVFSDDSKSFAQDEIDDDEDDDSQSTNANSQTPRRAFIKRAVSELSRDGPTPERLAMTAKKIEEMISSLKQSRGRRDDGDDDDDDD